MRSLGRWLGHGGRAFLNRIGVYEETRERWSLSAMWWHSSKTAIYKLGRRISLRARPCWQPDLRLPASRTLRNKCLLFKVPYLCPSCCGSVGCVLFHKRSQVQFPVRAHAWVVGSVPGQGVYGRQPVNVSLSHQCFSHSLNPSLPLSLKSKIKIKKKLKYPICGIFVIEVQWEQDKYLLGHFTAMAFCIPVNKIIHFSMAH